MKRQVLYSASRRPNHAAADSTRVPAAAPTAIAAEKSRFPRLSALASRHALALRFFAGALIATIVAAALVHSPSRPSTVTQEAIDTAVLHALENRALPSRAAKAAEVVRPSVVRVNGFVDSAAAKGKPKDRSKRPPPIDPHLPDKRAEKGGIPGMEQVSIGSGVVIVDDGTILTNFHVVYGVKRVTVTFHDGSESEAALVSAHPENDLAVIKAQKFLTTCLPLHWVPPDA